MRTDIDTTEEPTPDEIAAALGGLQAYLADEAIMLADRNVVPVDPWIRAARYDGVGLPVTPRSFEREWRL